MFGHRSLQFDWFDIARPLQGEPKGTRYSRVGKMRFPYLFTYVLYQQRKVRAGCSSTGESVQYGYCRPLVYWNDTVINGCNITSKVDCDQCALAMFTHENHIPTKKHLQRIQTTETPPQQYYLRPVGVKNQNE